MEKHIFTIKNKILPQKKVSFFDFPCVLSSNYDEMSNAVKDLEAPILFGRPTSSVIVRPRLFGSCSIVFTFDFFDEEFLGESDRLISEKFGKPLYYDRGGRKIWEHERMTVVSGGIEISYNVVVHSVTVCFGKPLMKKYPYEKWDKLSEIGKDVAGQWGIEKLRVMVAGGKLFMLCFETEEYQYSFTLIGRKLKMNSFKKELCHGVECPDYYTYKHDWSQTSKIKRLTDIEVCANSFFLYMEEYDKSLKRREN